MSDEPKKGLASVAKYVHPKVAWSDVEFSEFLEVLPTNGLISLQKSLQLIAPDSSETSIDDLPKVREAIRNQLIWDSSNIISYPFGGSKVAYHDLVKWVAGEFGVDKWIIDTQPTLVIERSIQEKLFVDIWDKLTPEQRRELLSKVDASGQIADKAAVAALSGAGALAALSLTVHMAGFAFYATMSTVICATAGFFGVTLPFAAYTSASALVAFLSGPVGWALLAIAAAAGVALAGRANYRKTAAAICQIHALKVAALEDAKEKTSDLFGPIGDPLRRQLVGRWQISSKEEILHVSLLSDGAAYFVGYNPSSEGNHAPSLAWEGKGNWSIREGVLTISRTHVWWKIYWSSNERKLIDSVEVKDVGTTAIQLKDSISLKRL